MNLLKSIVHNIGVVAVGFGFALLGRRIDVLLRLPDFRSTSTAVAGGSLVSAGFAIRVWATLLFYERRMRVISLEPQHQLVTSGPYRFSRNPLYLGGNFFIFSGDVFIVGSPAGIILTAINMLAVDAMIRREEKQLQRQFGEEWERYRRRVRRWL